MKQLVLLMVSAVCSQAAILVYDVDLTGPGESPPNASPGTGTATVTIDTVAHTLRVQAVFAGLLGTTSASHIHCCTAAPNTGTAGVATQVPSFVGFPLGVTSGSYDQTFSTLADSFYNPAFESANGATAASAQSALLAGIAAQTAYLNIHTSVVPGGEIRGFLIAAPDLTGVPEPGTWVLAGAGLLALWRRRR
jgi:hypothetical protein